MTTCAECAASFETWGCIKLCDRCLCARLWRELERDDWLMIRRHPNGDIWVKSRLEGTQHSTNASVLKIDIRKWFEERIEEFA